MSQTESSIPPEKLLEWLRAIESTGCIRIEARHINAGNEGGSAVTTFEIKDTEDGGERFDGPLLWKRLEEDAETFGGVQRYTLLAFRENSKAPRDRLTIRVDGGTSDDASSSEPANAHGLVAQAHRHNEALMRMVVTMSGSTIESMRKMISEMQASREQQESDRVEMWNIIRQASVHDRERDEEKHKQLLEEKRADVMRDGIKLLLPAFAAKISQVMGTPTPSNVQETGISRFIESLSDEQRAAFFQVLSPDQQIALGTLLDSMIKKESKEEKSNG